MGQLLNAVKLAIRQASEANPPAAVMLGVVTSAEPLSVLVDNRFNVSGDMLIPLRGLVEGEFPATHNHVGLGNAEKETYIGLTAGEKVVLLRDQGGSRFVILGRL